MTLNQMYNEERANKGIRASVLAVAERTGWQPDEVADRLGIPRRWLQQTSVHHTSGVCRSVTEPCDGCGEAKRGREQFSLVTGNSGRSLRFCAGCWGDVCDMFDKL